MQNIFLIGPMGAGKSTIGRVLAGVTGMQFYDSDDEIEKRTGADIPWIFDVEGESGFRKRESSAIDDLTAKKNIVLATGGGAVKTPINRRYLHDRGMVVYLKTSVEKQFSRTSHDEHRPLLNNSDPMQTLTMLLKEREPWYLETAHIVVETDNLSIKTTAQKIIDEILALEKKI